MMTLKPAARPRSRKPLGSERRNSTVSGPVATTSLTASNSPCLGLSTPVGGKMMWLKLATTSSAVSGAPSWNFTPSRSTKVGSVSKVEVTTPMALICKALFPSISTFETLPSTASHKAIVRRYLEAVDQRNVAILDDIVATDCIIHRPEWPEPLRGLGAFKQFFERIP